MTDPSLDVWRRMARLDRCCHFNLRSAFVDSESVDSRKWRVEIRHRHLPIPPVIVQSDRALEAIVLALEAVERLGWDAE